MSVSILKNAGLNTADNPFSSVKDGSFKTADNVVVRANNIVEPRRGQALEENAFASSTADTFTFFDGGRLVHHDTDQLASITSGMYAALTGTYAAPSASTLRMKFAEAQQNLYFTSSVGVQVLDEITSSTARWAGVPAAELHNSVTWLSGEPDATGAWLPIDSSVAYRIVFCYTDSDGLIHEGPPSGRGVVINPPNITTSAVLSRALNKVTATFATPHGFQVGDKVRFTGTADGTFNPGPTGTTGHVLTAVTDTTFTYAETGINANSGSTHTFTSGAKSVAPQFWELCDSGGAFVDSMPIDLVRIYRSATFSPASVEPNDELYLFHEFPYAYGDGVATSGVTALYTFVDKTPDTALYSSPLYTNPRTGASLLQSNKPPPLARDICAGQERLWYANTTSPHRLEVQLLGVSAPDGWQVTDTVTIGGHTYMLKGARASYDEAVLSTSGATPSINVERTAKSLVSAINFMNVGQPAGVRAFYISGEDDAPGKILFEEFGVGGSGFTFATSRTSAWNPNSTPQYSRAEACPNRIYYSKYAEPEAVPSLNFVDVGAKNKAILRIRTLRDKLFVFKEDAIYTVSGDPAYGLRVDLLDSTAWILAPDSLVAANNRLYCLTNQGFAAVSEGGVEIISRPIEDQIASGFLAPIAAGTPAVKAMVWGAAYDSERLVLFGLTTSSSSTTADQIFVYNYLVGAWTRWPLARKFAAVDPTTDKLWLASADTNKLITERKTFTQADYVDSAVPVTITSVDTAANTVTVSDASGLSVGDGISDGTLYAIITAIDGNVLTITEAVAP